MFSRILFIGFAVLFVAKPADTFAWMGDATPEMAQLELFRIKMSLHQWDTAYELRCLGQKRNVEWKMRHNWLLKNSYWGRGVILFVPREDFFSNTPKAH